MCCLLFCEIGKRPAANAAGLFHTEGKIIMRKGKKKEDSCLRTEGKRRRRCKGEGEFCLCCNQYSAQM